MLNKPVYFLTFYTDCSSDCIMALFRDQLGCCSLSSEFQAYALP